MARGAAAPESERLSTARRERFCQEYLKDLNATQAAIRAGYSRRSAKQDGHRLLHIPEVEARILELLERRAERTELKQDEVITGLRAEATYFGHGSSCAARVSALVALGKHLRMFVEQHEHTGPNGGPIETTSPRERIASRLARLADASGAPGDPSGAV